MVDELGRGCPDVAMAGFSYPQAEVDIVEGDGQVFLVQVADLVVDGPAHGQTCRRHRRQALHQLQALVIARRGARKMLVGMAGDAADHAAVLRRAIQVQQLRLDTADLWRGGVSSDMPGRKPEQNVYYDNIHLMIDWAAVTGFDWDEGNARKSADKHGVGQAEAEQVFFNEPLVVAEDLKHGDTEPRFHALGKTDANRLLHITFTLRASDTLIRVISARDMHRKERNYHEQASQDDT